MQVRAQVGASRAKLVTSRIDFGLVRLNGTGERPLVIRNASNTCATPWSVRELTPAVIAQVGGVGDGVGDAGGREGNVVAVLQGGSGLCSHGERASCLRAREGS